MNVSEITSNSGGQFVWKAGNNQHVEALDAPAVSLALDAGTVQHVEDRVSRLLTLKCMLV